jgi:hypothetical protein
VIPIVIATKPDGSAFGNLFFASEALVSGLGTVLAKEYQFAVIPKLRAACLTDSKSAPKRRPKIWA